MTSILDVLLPLSSYPLVILLVDDQLIVAKLVEKMIKEGLPSAVFHYCADAEKAVETALEVRPSLILQDLVMPGRDGLDLLSSYRNEPRLKNIPVIVLSAQEDPKVKAEAFARGANDYIVKLPDRIEFIARIRYHSDSYIHLMERNEAFNKLEASQRLLNEELSEAAEYVRSLLPEPIKEGEIITEWSFIPSTQLGGDAFGYHWISPEVFVIYLLDVCGHGVGAALLSISVMNALRSQTLPNAKFDDPASVLKALNLAFQMETQHNMFFTMWYGVYFKKTRQLVYGSAGHPPAVLTDQGVISRSKIETLRTPAPAIGIDKDVEFSNGSIEVQNNDVLYIYSDGIIELDKKNGRIGTLTEWMDALKIAPYTIKDETLMMVEQARAIQGKSEFADDFSLLKITFPAAS